METLLSSSDIDSEASISSYSEEEGPNIYRFLISSSFFLAILSMWYSWMAFWSSFYSISGVYLGSEFSTVSFGYLCLSSVALRLSLSAETGLDSSFCMVMTQIYQIKYKKDKNAFTKGVSMLKLKIEIYKAWSLNNENKN